MYGLLVTLIMSIVPTFAHHVLTDQAIENASLCCCGPHAKLCADALHKDQRLTSANVPENSANLTEMTRCLESKVHGNQHWDSRLSVCCSTLSPISPTAVTDCQATWNTPSLTPYDRKDKLMKQSAFSKRMCRTPSQKKLIRDTWYSWVECANAEIATHAASDICTYDTGVYRCPSRVDYSNFL